MNEVEVRRQALTREADAAVREANTLASAETLSASTRKKIDALLAHAASLRSQASTLRSDEERIAQLNAALQEENLPTIPQEERTASSISRAEVRKFLRGELRAALGTNNNGQYLVAPEFNKEIINAMAAFSPLYPGSPYCRTVYTRTGAPMAQPLLDDSGAEAFVQQENPGAVTNEQEPATIARVLMGAYSFNSGRILVSNEGLDDFYTSVEDLFRDSLARRFGKGFGRKFTVGSGTGEPNGIMNQAGLGATSDVPTAFGYQHIEALKHSVNESYRLGRNVYFMCAEPILQYIRTLVDSNGRPLLKETPDGKDKLLGYDVHINPFMDSTVAATKRVLAYGNFDYCLIRAVGREIAVQRLVQTYAELFQTGLIGRWRADVALAIPAGSDAPVKYLQMHA